MLVTTDDVGSKRVPGVILAQGDFDLVASRDDSIKKRLGLSQWLDPNAIMRGIVREKADLPLLTDVRRNCESAAQPTRHGATQKIRNTASH
jgi:hypothetical protein